MLYHLLRKNEACRGLPAGAMAFVTLHCTIAACSRLLWLAQGGVLWQLLHGVAKTKGLLGKAKRAPSHPCDVSITIGPQVHMSASLEMAAP
jgi:hypothetical protein